MRYTACNAFLAAPSFLHARPAAAHRLHSAAGRPAADLCSCPHAHAATQPGRRCGHRSACGARAGVDGAASGRQRPHRSGIPLCRAARRHAARYRQSHRRRIGDDRAGERVDAALPIAGRATAAHSGRPLSSGSGRRNRHRHCRRLCHPLETHCRGQRAGGTLCPAARTAAVAARCVARWRDLVGAAGGRLSHRH